MLNLPHFLDKNTRLTGYLKLLEVSPGQRRQVLILILDILKRKIQNLNTLPKKN